MSEAVAGARPAAPPAVCEVPFDLAATERLPAWRDGFAWPVAQARVRAAADALCREIFEFVQGLPEGGSRDVALLAAPTLMIRATVLGAAALAARAAEDTSIRLIGGPPELDRLLGRESGGSDADFTPPSAFARPRIRFPALRRVARVASWTSPWRLPAAVLAPSATAVSHNALMRAFARQTRARVDFLHAQSLVRGPAGPVTEQPARLASDLATRLARRPVVDGETGERFLGLLREDAAVALARAERALASLSAARRIPSRLWSASTGYFPARALCIEARRRGGRTTVFSHGGDVGTTERPHAMAVTDLAVADRFVAATPGLARVLEGSSALGVLPASARPEVIGGPGDPTFRSPRDAPGRPARERRLVIYPPVAFIGFRQVLPPILPDVVLLDWQLRLAAALHALPVDLLCKPHPEGVLRGAEHPIASVAPTSDARFEAIRDRADVFVFDYGQSTTFWEALCTDRPIVFLDMGMTTFSAAIRPLVHERCRVVPVTYDAANRPQVDPGALAEAVCSGPGRAGGDVFRALLTGEGGAP